MGLVLHEPQIARYRSDAEALALVDETRAHRPHRGMVCGTADREASLGNWVHPNCIRSQTRPSVVRPMGQVVPHPGYTNHCANSCFDPLGKYRFSVARWPPASTACKKVTVIMAAITTRLSSRTWEVFISQFLSLVSRNHTLEICLYHQ